MVELNVSHLKITTQTHCNCECNSFQTSHSLTPWKQRTGRERGLTVHLYTRFWEFRCQQFIKIVYLQSASWHGVFFYVLRRIPAQGTRLKHVHVHKLPLEVMNEPVCWGWWKKKSVEVLRGCTSGDMRAEQAECVKLLYKENNHTLLSRRLPKRDSLWVLKVWKQRCLWRSD